MREKSQYQKNVAMMTQTLRDREIDSYEEAGEKLFQKFKSSGQEPIKMALSLWGYFHSEGIKESWRKEFETYLKIRIRNAVEALIEEDEPEKIQVFEEAGWFGEVQLDGFLKIARERQKMQALLYLMNLKNEKYGFKDQEFLL